MPSGFFKAVYHPKRRQAAAYVVPNAAGDRWEEVSLSELQRLTGIDVFPELPPAIKDCAMALPAPRAHGDQERSRAEPDRDRCRPSPVKEVQAPEELP